MGPAREVQQQFSSTNACLIQSIEKIRRGACKRLR